MKRTLVTNKELATWLTAELRKIEDCQDCTINGVLPLRDFDEFGCNWSVDPLIVRCTDVSKNYLKQSLEPIIAKARQLFNLKH